MKLSIQKNKNIFRLRLRANYNPKIKSVTSMMSKKNTLFICAMKSTFVCH